jgi:hypothetical protein
VLQSQLSFISISTHSHTVRAYNVVSVKITEEIYPKYIDEGNRYIITQCVLVNVTGTRRRSSLDAQVPWIQAAVNLETSVVTCFFCVGVFVITATYIRGGTADGEDEERRQPSPQFQSALF